MRALLSLFTELLWLAGAALFAWSFLWTFLGIQAAAAAMTLVLRVMERRWQ